MKQVQEKGRAPGTWAPPFPAPYWGLAQSSQLWGSALAGMELRGQGDALPLPQGSH